MKIYQRFDRGGFAGDLTLFSSTAHHHSFHSDHWDEVNSVITKHLDALAHELNALYLQQRTGEEPI